MNYSAILWDWNGTLLDDLDYSIATVGKLLTKRGMPTFDKEKYYRIFGFPVIDYYKRIGFDFQKESYETVAEEFIARYNADVDTVPLRKGVKEALAVYADKKIPQYILSASEKEILLHGLKIRGIDGYFNDIIALDNIYAEGKASLAMKYFSEHPLGGKAVLIGDTDHDAEVASQIGADCILVSGGHMSKEKLDGLGVQVVAEVNETYRYVLPTGRGERRMQCDLSFVTKYKEFYDDLKNTSRTEDW